MSLYYLSALAAAVVSALLTAGLIRWAKKRQLFMTAPRERDLHQQPTPRIGGMAVVGAFVAIVILLNFLVPNSLNFSGQTFWGFDRNLFGLLAAIILLAAVNILDDYRNVRVLVRLMVETLAAWLIVVFGITISWLSNPLGGQIMLGLLSPFFVVVWLVGLSNVTNWLDGVNGLAGGVGAIAMAVLFFLSIRPDVAQAPNALLAAVAFGALVGFLPFNIIRAKAFLGDTGSVFIGFLLGVLAIISGGKVATAFLVLAIPFLDAVVVVITRLFARQSPFAADQRHLHHRLLEAGLKPWQIVGLFYAISLIFGLIALNTQAIGKLWAAAFAMLLMIALVLLYSYKGNNGQTR